METIEFEVDTELMEEINKRIRPCGLTVENLIERFLCWMVTDPEVAKAYLEKAAEEESGNSGLYVCQSTNE